ncbi:hypothetical protein KV097_14065 [Mumia sp. zg.B17]|uniref:hypothetical protein n=1 Tax=Mumia sp. zg.B17 TaxID=2855446 RepID=UPI001C6ECD92|nr:hypothetical protein [Mumia sp. zg.B17]MBW9207068.1 hypothetical protein [Mumia sp. zg.B17]
MNDDDLRQRLDAVADRAPDGDELLDRIAARRRTGRLPGPPPTRSRRVAPLLAAAACAVLVLAVAFVPSLLGGSASDDDLSRPSDAGRSDTVPSAVATPSALPLAEMMDQGVRPVGRGRIVIDVPVSWRSVQPQCDEPVVDGYFFTVGVFRACHSSRPAGITTVQLDSLVATGGSSRDPRPTSRLDGVPYGVARSTRAGVTTAVVVVPAHDVRLTVRGPAGSVELLISTLRVLAPDQVAVPQLGAGVSGGAGGHSALPTVREMRRRLARVGLELDVVTRDGATSTRFAQARVTPRAGSVVDVGSSVLVELEGVPR